MEPGHWVFLHILLLVFWLGTDLGVLILALHSAFHFQKPRTTQRATITRCDIRIDHQIGGAVLILDGDENHALGGTGALAHQHKPCQAQQAT